MTGPYVFSVDDLEAVQNGNTESFLWRLSQVHAFLTTIPVCTTRAFALGSLEFQMGLSDPEEGVSAFTFTGCNRYNCSDDQCEEAAYRNLLLKATPDEIGCMKPPHDTSSP